MTPIWTPDTYCMYTAAAKEATNNFDILLMLYYLFKKKKKKLHNREVVLNIANQRPPCVIRNSYALCFPLVENILQKNPHNS